MKRVGDGSASQFQQNSENQDCQIIRLGEDGILSVLKWLDGYSLVQRAGRVCQYWYGLIIKPENQKFILFRSVQLTHISVHRRSGDLDAAKKVCDDIYSTCINQDEVDYFRNLKKEILDYESKVLQLLKQWVHHDNCRRTVENLLLRGGQNLLKDHLETLEEHIIKLMHNMFQFLEKRVGQGYGIIIPEVLQKALTRFDEKGKGKIVDELCSVLVKGERRIAIQIIQEEASSFYKVLKCLCNADALAIQKSTMVALGLMLLQDSKHSNDAWTLFLEKFASSLEIRQYFFESVKGSKEFDANKKVFGSRMIAFLELEISYFIEWLQANIENFVFFLVQLIDNDVSIFNHFNVRALLAIGFHEGLELDDKLEEKRRLCLKRYFQIEIKLCDKKIQGNGCLEIVDRSFVDLALCSKVLRDQLLDYLLEGVKSSEDCILVIRDLITGEEAKAENISLKKGSIEAIVSNMLKQASKKKLGFFIPVILEKLMLAFGDEGRIAILNLFKDDLTRNSMVNDIEHDFNSYFRVFTELPLDCSFKVKAEAVMVIGVMALNFSEKNRNKVWGLFLTVISQDRKILEYVRREISLSEGLLSGGAKLNFGEKTWRLVEQNCPAMIQCFNDYADILIKFFDDQLLNIRKVSVKVEASLALIAFCINKKIKKSDVHEKKIKDIINNQLKWTPNLLLQIEERIKALIAFDDFQKDVMEFLKDLKPSQLISTGSTSNTSRTSSLEGNSSRSFRTSGRSFDTLLTRNQR